MSKSEKAVAVVTETPAYLRELEKQGPVDSHDNFDQSDITIPRVKLLQALSKEMETFDAAKNGHFWHTGMDVDLGVEFQFIPVSRRKKYLLVAPIEDGQGILARAEDFVHWQPPSGEFQVKLKGRKEAVTWKLAPTVAESGLAEWGTMNPDDPSSPPAATLFYEYLILLPDNLGFGPVVLSLTRSQIKKTRKGLNDKIKLHESAGRPMQSPVFVAKAVKDQSAAGDYQNFQFNSSGFASEEVYKQALELKDVLSTYKVQDEEAAAQTDETEAKPAEEAKDF